MSWPIRGNPTTGGPAPGALSGLRASLPPRPFVFSVTQGTCAARLVPPNLEKHGFTQYRKAGGGYYEKTARGSHHQKVIYHLCVACRKNA